MPTQNNCSFQFCSSAGRVKNEHRKAFDNFKILILFIATQRPMKSVLTAWKVDILDYNLQPPVFHGYFFFFFLEWKTKVRSACDTLS